jgi:hypothetical protein
MTNEPQTYYAIVELPDVTGEESDSLIDFAEYWIREHVHETAIVYHLTPETLPDRYIERAPLRQILHDWIQGQDGKSATAALLKIRDLLR